MPDSQTIFVAVGATGFLILLLSVLLGEIGGHGGDFGEHPGDVGGHGGELGGPGGELGGHGGGDSMGDAGGHLGDPGDAVGNAVGHAGDPGVSAGNAGGQSGALDHPGANDVPEGSADLDAPTWRSIRVLAVSLVGFGAAGFAATASGVPALLAWPVAAAGFLAVGAAAFRFILKPLAAQQYNSMTSRYGWIGRTGVVTLDILPYGTGQVTFHDRQGARITQTATSDRAEGVPKGSAVTITDLSAGGVVVHRSAFSD